MIPLLKVFAEYEPNKANISVTASDVHKPLLDLLNIDSLIEERTFHARSNMPITYYRRFMQLHEVYYTADSFKKGVQLSPEELNVTALMHNI